MEKCAEMSEKTGNLSKFLIGEVVHTFIERLMFGLTSNHEGLVKFNRIFSGLFGIS